MLKQHPNIKCALAPRLATISNWSVVIRWNDGTTETYTDLSGGQSAAIYTEQFCKHAGRADVVVDRFRGGLRYA